MDASLLHALILGLVEGVTEFLPISSTGHLIIAGQLLGFSDDKAKVFDIVIQSGAMLAIVWEYRARFARVLAGLPGDPAARRFAANLVIAFMPAALLDAGDLGPFSIGFAVSFVSAFLCVRWLLRYIATHDFSVFAWYRIVFGVIVLATAYTGVVNWAP